MEEELWEGGQPKFALLLDQMGGTNLVSAEARFRRLQTIEYAHDGPAREAESQVVGGRMSLDEQSVFLESIRSPSSGKVRPEFLPSVREEVERDAKLAKAPRTAREECEDRRKKGHGKEKT